MSPSQSSFRLEAILTSWICLQSEHVFARYAFLISSQSSFWAGDCFWQLDLYEKWSCIYEWRVFSNFVPILISAGGILTNWICSQSDHVFAVEGFLISFLSSLWQKCRNASKTTNLKQLLLTSKFTFWPQGVADLQETQLLPWQKLVLTAKIASTQQLLWYSTATSNHQICFLEPQSRTWKKQHQRYM